MQLVLSINLFLLEWNSKYMTTGARNDLRHTASSHINSVDTRLIWGKLEKRIQLVLSNDEI